MSSYERSRARVRAQSALLDSEVGAPTRRLPPGAKAKVARAMSDIARSFADGDDSNRPSRL